MKPHSAHNAPAPAAPTAYAWVIVAVAFMSMGLVIGSRFSIGLFLPHMPEALDASAANVAAAFAIPLLGSAALQPLAGVMIDRLGGRYVLSLGLGAAGIALCGTSFAVTAWQVALFMGIFSSVAYAAVSPMSVASIVSGWFEANRGRALGIATSGTKVALIVLPPFLGTLIAAYGWRTAMFALAVIVWALIPAVLMLARPAPGSEAARRAERRAADRSEVPSPDGDDPPSPSDDPGLKRALAMPAFWLVAVMLFANGFVMTLVFLHLPSFVLARGYSVAVAATGLAVLGGIGIFGNVLTGVLSDSLGRRVVLLIMFAARGVATVLLVLAPGPVTFVVFIAVMGFLGYGAIGVIGALGADLFGRRAVGTILGTAYVFNHVGGAAGTYAGGASVEWTGGYDAALWVAVAATACALVCISAIDIGRRPAQA